MLAKGHVETSWHQLALSWVVQLPLVPLCTPLNCCTPVALHIIWSPSAVTMFIIQQQLSNDAKVGEKFNAELEKNI